MEHRLGQGGENTEHYTNLHDYNLYDHLLFLLLHSAIMQCFAVILNSLLFVLKCNIYNCSSRIACRYFCLSFLSGGLLSLVFQRPVGSERHINLQRIDIPTSFKIRACLHLRCFHYCQLHTSLNLRMCIDK